MKRKSSFTLLFLCLFLLGKTEGKDWSSPRQFTIEFQGFDLSVSENQTKFKFTFYENGEICTKRVRIGFNQLELTGDLDKNGIYSRELKSGKYKLFFLIEGCNEIISDSIIVNSQERLEASIYFQKTEQMIMVFKPVIYVYPEKITDVNIQLNVNGNLGFTYPLYNKGWDFTASPNGSILLDGKEYNYLFWESEMPKYTLDRKDKTGFLVDTDTLLPFLENSLSQMGFNSKESADFITFWYPRMMTNEKNHVKFLFNESCDAYAELKISPQPDHIFRVGMVWAEATNDFIPEKQIIPSFDRNGFTILEWGGMIDNTLFTNEN